MLVNPKLDFVCLNKGLVGLQSLLNPKYIFIKNKKSVLKPLAKV